MCWNSRLNAAENSELENRFKEIETKEQRNGKSCRTLSLFGYPENRL